MVSVALGLVVVLFVSGLIEAFVTRRPADRARVGIGVLAEGAFLAYVIVFGTARPRNGANETRRPRARPATSAPDAPDPHTLDAPQRRPAAFSAR